MKAELNGEIITTSSFSHSNRNHLTIEVLGKQNTIGNLVKSGDRVRIIVLDKDETESPKVEGEEDVDGIKKLIKSNLSFQGGSNDKEWLQASVKHYINSGSISGSFYQAIKSAMTEYASIKCAEKDKGIEELEAKVNELTMDNMTHEYNQAEAERFAPEYQRQIEEPLKARIEELEKENERLRGALGNLLEQYHYECCRHAEKCGIDVEEWVSDLVAYNEAKSLLPNWETPKQ